MMKIALLDFDDVLFNTSAFSVASRKVFIDSGVSEKEHDEFYQQMREDFKAKGTAYHRNEHVVLFTERFPKADSGLLKKNLAALHKTMPGFVYDDTSLFLESLSKNGWHRVILTFGNDDWQKQKVGFSGVDKMVDEVVVSPDASKVGAAEEILKKHPKAMSVIFIDDNPYRALHSVKEKFPHVRTIQLIRPELEAVRERHLGCDHDCQNLLDIAKILGYN